MRLVRRPRHGICRNCSSDGAGHGVSRAWCNRLLLCARADAISLLDAAMILHPHMPRELLEAELGIVSAPEPARTAKQQGAFPCLF